MADEFEISTYTMYGITHKVQSNRDGFRHIGTLDVGDNIQFPKLSIDKEGIPEAIAYLNAINSKFREWYRVAKLNNVKKLIKEFKVDEPQPRMMFSWQTRKGLNAAMFDNNEIIPFFLVIDGKISCTFYIKEDTKSITENQESIEAQSIMIFASPAELSSLIDALDDRHIDAKAQRERNEEKET